jgi:hypothetical protein
LSALQCKFSYILTKLNAHSCFHFLCNSECDNDRNTPVFYLRSHENEKT